MLRYQRGLQPDANHNCTAERMTTGNANAITSSNPMRAGAWKIAASSPDNQAILMPSTAPMTQLSQNALSTVSFSTYCL